MAKRKKIEGDAGFEFAPVEFTGVTYTVEKAPKMGGPLQKYWLYELHIEGGVVKEKRVHKHAMIQEELFMRLDNLNREMFIAAARIRRPKREVA